MPSRRVFLGAATGALLATDARASRKITSRVNEIESQITRRDFRNLYKEDLPTPCMVVDLDLLDRNLRTMADHCRTVGIQLRGHVKVHKSPDIAQRQLKLGSIGVTCATVAECELMSGAGIPGVLLTRQPVGKNNINRTIALAGQDATFGTVVDDLLVADWLQEAAQAAKVNVKVVVDVYAGLSRHGIAAGEEAVQLAKKVDGSKNLKLIGLMGYSGGASHTKGWEQRKKKSHDDLQGLLESVALARKSGLPVQIVTGGSTGTYDIDSESKALTELQAGSFVFMDTLYRRIGGRSDPAVYTNFEPALTVMTRVVSKRHPHQCTIDAGNKALLRPTDEVKGRPEVQVQNQGAEYGILAWKDGEKDFKLGERVELYPSNLDMSTNVYDRYYVARGEKIVDVWPIMGRSGAAQR
jgi:D-serine deaminase-like pyridoxal phosphate-dependent protein